MSNLFQIKRLILAEQISNLLPAGGDEVDNYIAPLLKAMTDKWAVIKTWLWHRIIRGARADRKRQKGKQEVIIGGMRFEIILLEASLPFEMSRSEMKDIIKELNAKIDQYKEDVAELAGHIRQQAEIDASPLMTGKVASPIMISPTTPVSIILSKDGLKAVIDALDSQMVFIDDLRLSTAERIEKLLTARYDSIAHLERETKTLLRLDRDTLMDKFVTSCTGLGDDMIAGRVTAEEFIIGMKSRISDHYKRLYLTGKGTPNAELLDWEKELLRKQVEGQYKYLDNFKLYINTQDILGNDLTGRVRWRAGLYAQRGSSIYELGYVTSLPDDALLDWVMAPAEHCNICPIFSANSPYTKDTLPGYPGEGFHLTSCGTNCKCSIQVSLSYQKSLTKNVEL